MKEIDEGFVRGKRPKGFSCSVLVGFDVSVSGDNAVLIVGKQEKGKVDIINAFSGEEAIELYTKLTEKGVSQLEPFTHGILKDSLEGKLK